MTNDNDMRTCFMLAAVWSRFHADLSEKALQVYGSHGPLISGCTRDHFPEMVKDELRKAARMVSYWNERGRECKPPRMHWKTVHRIAREIVARDGSGRYGY